LVAEGSFEAGEAQEVDSWIAVLIEHDLHFSVEESHAP
jgi:hypothetical protein